MTAFPQLDLRIKKIDPAWPVIHPKPVASAPTVPNGASNTKIHVNPNFVSKTVTIRCFFPLPLHLLLQQAKAKTPPVVDETEKMREELLRAEAELIQLKKMQVEQQILEAKKSLQQVSNIIIHYFSKETVKYVITAEIKASCLSTVVISLRVSLNSTVVIYSIIIIANSLWADEFLPSIVFRHFLKFWFLLLSE